MVKFVERPRDKQTREKHVSGAERRSAEARTLSEFLGWTSRASQSENEPAPKRRRKVTQPRAFGGGARRELLQFSVRDARAELRVSPKGRNAF